MLYTHYGWFSIVGSVWEHTQNKTSKENNFYQLFFLLLLSIMKKTFCYLLFMVIFLPTFGFTTAQASIEFLWNTNKNDTYRWECIFLPDSGAFFVNYVTTAALVGAGLELIRFPDLFWYFIQICWSRSRAENPAIQRNIRYEFRFGEHYLRSYANR